METGRKAYINSLRVKELIVFLERYNVPVPDIIDLITLRQMAYALTLEKGLTYDELPEFEDSDYEVYRPFAGGCSSPMPPVVSQQAETSDSILLLANILKEALSNKNNSGNNKKELKEFRQECDKAKVKFSGLPSERLDVFLKKIRSIRKVVEITDKDLLNVFPVLLCGAAKTWFENASKRFNTWQACEIALKNVYLPTDYDDILRQDLTSRTQAPNERFDHFIATLETANSELSEPLTEQQMIRLALRNLRPHHRVPLAGKTFASLENLTSFVRALEDAMMKAKQFVEPSPRILSDELFGLPKEDKVIRDIKIEKDKFQPTRYPVVEVPISSSIPRPNEPKAPITCFRCHKVGHISSQCPIRVNSAAAAEFLEEVGEQTQENEYAD